MSNERLGIYDELRARAEQYSEYERVRRRMVDPVAILTGTPYPQPFNPFIRKLRYRFKVIGPGDDRRRRDRRVYPEAKYGISIDLVVKTVIDESGVTAEDIFSSWQTHRVARPRQVAIYMIDRYCPQYSLPKIGLIFGRDHTTVIHAIRAVTERLDIREPSTIDLVARAHTRLRELAG